MTIALKKVSFNVQASVLASYSTVFPLTENPISETSKWDNGGVVGGSWTNVRTTPGKAFAAALTQGYNDGIAILTAAALVATPNQFAQGTVSRAGGYTNAIQHEIELLLRFSLSNGNAHGYEVLWQNSGAINLVRWNGGLGLYDNWEPAGNPSPNIGLAVDGDVLRVEIVGNIVTIKKNSIVVWGGVDISKNQDGSTTSPIWTTGQPGMGFWPNDPAAIPANYCWKAYSAGNL